MGDIAEIIRELLQDAVELDRSVTLFLNGLHIPQSDALWCFMSKVKIWFPMYGLIGVLMVSRLGWRKGLTMAVACALGIVCVDQGDNLVKELVGRLRPCQDPYMILNGLYLPDSGMIRNTSFGFFSAHAGNAACFAACSSKAMRSKFYGFLIFLWAFLVGLSRVFKGAHFLGDVLVGWTVGIAVGLVMAALAGLFYKKVLKCK